MPDRHYVMQTPTGEVHAVVTDEIRVVARRVRDAIGRDEEPDPRDLAKLRAWADDGPHHG